MNDRTSLLRPRTNHEAARVGSIELFFDLVFVFAVTQLSHALLGHLTLAGAAQVGLLLVAVWWVWIYTSWVTNWLDPERIPVRVCLFVLMIVGVLLASSIPSAYGSRGVTFAASYALMQVGRTLFFLWALRGASLDLRRNFRRVLLWFVLSAVFWIVGAQAQGDARFAWWLLAMGIDLVAPSLLFWVPGLGRSATTEWNIEGGHLAERCSLFVIIALGESLLVTGATFAGLEWDRSTQIGMLVAVSGSILMWWIYFDTGAERALHRIRHSTDPGREGRSAYTYVHVLIVAGIVVCAVADELVLTHAHHATDAAIVAILGGPAGYLVGTASFKWITNDRKTPPLSHVAGLVLLGSLTWPAMNHLLTPLALGAATTGVLAVVAVWEAIALRRAS